MRVAAGTSSCSSPSCLDASSAAKKFTPVAVPPGRFRLTTRPSLAGSSTVTKTIGIVVVAAFAACAEGVPVAAITVTRSRTRSVASADNRPYLTLRPAVFDRHVLAFNIAGFLRPAWNDATCRRNGPLAQRTRDTLVVIDRW